jgi:hypothetical protein
VREDITLFFLFVRGLLTYICGGREDITLFVLLGRGLLTYVAGEKTSPSSYC